MEWKSVSFVGSREINEDCVKVIELEELKCFIVADGLGGHGKGDIASNIACKAFEEIILTTSNMSISELMLLAFKKAQSSIIDEQRKNRDYSQMKTTVCVLMIKGSEVVWGHIGDTRLYAFCKNRVKVRTMDHSVPQMLVLAREIKEKHIRNHPERNKLLRVLGIKDDDPKFEISDCFEIGEFQAFLLCSDGFWELIVEKQMEKLLKKSSSVEEWIDNMSSLVQKNGMDKDMDNNSAIGVWV